MKAVLTGFMIVLFGSVSMFTNPAQASDAGERIAHMYYDELIKDLVTPQTPAQDFESFCRIMGSTFNQKFVSESIRSYIKSFDREMAAKVTVNQLLGYLAAYSIDKLNTLNDLREKGNFGYTWVGSEKETTYKSTELAKFKVRKAADADEVHLYISFDSNGNAKINNIGTSSIGITVLQSAGSYIEQLKGTGKDIIDAIGNYITLAVRDSRYRNGCP